MIKSKIKHWIKNLTWEDYVLLGIMIVLLIFFASYASGYKQIPSPIFGGDQYRNRGFVQNIASGESPWKDAFYLDELQYYGYFTATIEGYFIRLFHTNVDKTFLYFPLFFLIIMLITWYNLGKVLFKDKKWGLTLAISFMALLYSYNDAPGSVAFYIIIPALIYFWIRYESENKTSHAVLTGFCLGLLALTYGGAFVGMLGAVIGTIAILFIYDFSLKKEDLNFKQLWKLIIHYFKKYYLMMIVAAAVACIYFLPLFLRYHMHIVNNVPLWGDGSAYKLGWGYLWSNLTYTFFNTASIFVLLLSISVFIGLIIMLITKTSRDKIIIASIFFVNLIIAHHYLFTIPLFNKAFWPVKLGIYFILTPIFFVYLIKFIHKQITKESLQKTFIILVLIFCTVAFIITTIQTKNSQWEQYGRTDNAYSDELYKLASFIQNNVQANETILSNDESGFMLAVLSGRKVVLTRRTHASYYVDIDERIANASVAMYGNDVNLSRDILNYYHAKYFYIDSQLFQNPMRTRLGFEDYFNKYNVTFQKVYDRYDIARQPKDATMMDMLLIPPQNLTSQFIDLWQPIYDVKVSGQVVGQLWKLKE